MCKAVLDGAIQINKDGTIKKDAKLQSHKRTVNLANLLFQNTAKKSRKLLQRGKIAKVR
jgi:hypothetical protein